MFILSFFWIRPFFWMPACGIHHRATSWVFPSTGNANGFAGGFCKTACIDKNRAFYGKKG
jgi:hypothetical protein